MLNKKQFSFFLIALFLLPLTTLAGQIERYCFLDAGGFVYDFRGGKLGKKAYAVEVTSGDFCPFQTGFATFAELNNGYAVTALIGSDLLCSGYVISASVGDNMQTITGNIDFLPRSYPPDYTFTATRTFCSPL